MASTLAVTCVSNDELGSAIMYYCHEIAVAVSTQQAAPVRVCGSNAALVQKPAPDAKRESSPMEANHNVIPLIRGASLCSSSLLELVPKGHTHIGVLSFNVLADCYVRVEGQPWNAFAHCEDAHLAWEQRLPQVLQLLNGSGADVICLQEVMVEKRAPPGGGAEEWRLPSWTDQLQGYAGVLQGLKQKEWDKNSERNQKHIGRSIPTGVATFYNMKRFEESAASKPALDPASHCFCEAETHWSQKGLPWSLQWPTYTWLGIHRNLISI